MHACMQIFTHHHMYPWLLMHAPEYALYFICRRVKRGSRGGTRVLLKVLLLSACLHGR